MNYEILQFVVSRSFVVFPFGGTACSHPHHPQEILPTSVNACFLLCKISNTLSSSTMLQKDPSRFCFGLAALELIVYKTIVASSNSSQTYRVPCPSKSAASSSGIISEITELDFSIFFPNQQLKASFKYWLVVKQRPAIRG